MPYVRQTVKGKYVQERAQKYNNYRDAVALIMRSKWKPLESQYALLTVKVFLKPAKTTGEIPRNGGDWDNFYKVFADACQSAGIVKNDSVIVGPGPGSQNYLTSKKEYAEIELIPLERGGIEEAV